MNDKIDRISVRTLLSRVSNSWHMTGSRYICNPPPIDTDEDYIVYGNLHVIEEAFLQAGFKLTTDPEYDGGSWFLTFRLEEFNIIATDSKVFYERFVAATVSARDRNLLNKDDRIALFKEILYGDVVGKTYLFKGSIVPITEREIV